MIHLGVRKFQLKDKNKYLKIPKSKFHQIRKHRIKNPESAVNCFYIPVPGRAVWIWIMLNLKDSLVLLPCVACVVLPVPGQDWNLLMLLRSLEWVLVPHYCLHRTNPTLVCAGQKVCVSVREMLDWKLGHEINVATEPFTAEPSSAQCLSATFPILHFETLTWQSARSHIDPMMCLLASAFALLRMQETCC